MTISMRTELVRHWTQSIILCLMYLVVEPVFIWRINFRICSREATQIDRVCFPSLTMRFGNKTKQPDSMYMENLYNSTVPLIISNRRSITPGHTPCLRPDPA